MRKTNSKTKTSTQRRKVAERIPAPRQMWADYDPEYKTDSLVIYETKGDQRSNRPDLKPIPVLVIPFSGLLVRFELCPAGLFVFEDVVGFKNEYQEAFLLESGEVFWGGTNDPIARNSLKVEPLVSMPLRLCVKKNRGAK